MTNEQNGIAPPDIPVPPGGGSWRFDEATWSWVSNDLTPAVAVDAGADQVATLTIEQEQ